MIHNRVLLTRKGFELKKQRLGHCHHLLHNVIPFQLKMAKERDGDLLENREFIDLEIEKELLEAEVRRLEELLYNAKIIENETICSDQVEIGMQIILESNLRGGKPTSYELVSPAEVALEHNRISTSSPLGQLLLGKKIGDRVALLTPSGKIIYKIIGFQQDN